jgi:DNA-binding MarR family transcriptional regulator
VDLLPVLRRWITARVQQSGDDGELSVRQYAALRDIKEGTTSPGELARQWQVTPAVLTGVIDRLERRDLVRREIDPLDRRRFRLALTDCGLVASEAIERVLVGDLARQLAAIPDVEKAELGRSLELLRTTFASLESESDAAESNQAPVDCADWPDDGLLPADEHEAKESSLLNVSR